MITVWYSQASRWRQRRSRHPWTCALSRVSRSVHAVPLHTRRAPRRCASQHRSRPRPPSTVLRCWLIGRRSLGCLSISPLLPSVSLAPDPTTFSVEPCFMTRHQRLPRPDRDASSDCRSRIQIPVGFQVRSARPLRRGEIHRSPHACRQPGRKTNSQSRVNTNMATKNRMGSTSSIPLDLCPQRFVRLIYCARVVLGFKIRSPDNGTADSPCHLQGIPRSHRL